MKKKDKKQTPKIKSENRRKSKKTDKSKTKIIKSVLVAVLILCLSFSVFGIVHKTDNELFNNAGGLNVE